MSENKKKNYNDISKYPVNHPIPPAKINRDKLNAILREELNAWSIVKSPLPENTLKLRKELYREYKFSTFEKGIDFINKVAKICEVLQHHPRWEHSWKNLKIYLTTWDSQHIITYKDVMLARQMENLYEKEYWTSSKIDFIYPEDSTQLADLVKEHIGRNEIEDASQITFDFITRSKGMPINKEFTNFITEYYEFKNIKEKKNASKSSLSKQLKKTGMALKETMNKLYPKPKIYFSYAWGGEKEALVKDLYNELSQDSSFDIVIDKHDNNYMGLISNFMGIIGKGNLAIVVMSPKYLKSEYCMFELAELFRNSKLEISELQKKLIMIVAEPIKIKSPKSIRALYNYWKKEDKKWEVHASNHPKDNKRYLRINSICANKEALIPFLQDVNASTLNKLTKNNYAMIKKIIAEKISEIKKNQKN